MSSTTSSNGPGIGATPSAPPQRSGRGIRPSRRTIVTARTARLTNTRMRRLFYRSGSPDARSVGAPSANYGRAGGGWEAQKAGRGSFLRTHQRISHDGDTRRQAARNGDKPPNHAEATWLRACRRFPRHGTNTAHQPRPVGSQPHAERRVPARRAEGINRRDDDNRDDCGDDEPVCHIWVPSCGGLSQRVLLARRVRKHPGP